MPTASCGRLRFPGSAAQWERLILLANSYVEAIENWSCTVQDVIRFSTLAAELVGVVAQAPAIALTMAAHLAIGSPALRHAFAAAVLGIQLGRAIRLEARRQHTVAKAALFMNLPSLDLQDALLAPRAHPTDAQRITLMRHPQLAADLHAVRRVPICAGSKPSSNTTSTSMVRAIPLHSPAMKSVSKRAS